jgi:hypothetical protein
MKKLASVFALGLLLMPFAAFADRDDDRGPFFDDNNGNGYGGSVTICYRNETMTVSARQAQRLLNRGATPGACAAPGALTITKTAINGDGAFRFTISGPRVNQQLTIQTVNGTGAKTISLPAGTYSVTERQDRRWVQTGNTCANVAVASAATSTCAVTNTIKLASISGGTYIDVNGNGRLNFFERLFSRQSGVTVYLDTNNNKQLDSGEPSKVTDSNGLYTFMNLIPNTTYRVREVVPSGYSQTVPSNKVYVESPDPGENVTDDDFGNNLPGTRRPWWDF